MTLCIDIGGTHVRVAVSADGTTFLSKKVFDVPQDPAQALIMIKDAGGTPDAIVVGMPGTVSVDGAVISSPNLLGWQGFNLKNEFKKVFGIEPLITNDALLAALGEATYGAGVAYERVGFITVSTGIGGALIVGKAIPAHVSGFEPGRQVVEYIHRTSLQDLVSGAGVAQETGKSPNQTTDLVFWDTKAKTLAVGLWNSIVYWMPDVLVVGGPMVLGSPRISIEKTAQYVADIAHQGVVVPPIIPATLGDDAGLIGGLAFVSGLHS